MTFVNPYQDMENVYEDLTVNQQQAQFQAQQAQQTRANIMAQMEGAAGGSGIAALAQAMANQGQLTTRQISADIGQQEAQNQRLAAQGAGNVQTLERQGAAWVQQANMDRQATILGMEMGAATGANQAYAQAQSNQINAQVAQQQNMMNSLVNLGSTMGSLYNSGFGQGSPNPNTNTNPGGN